MTPATADVRLAERLGRLRDEPAYRNYLSARDRVLEMLDRGEGDTSTNWREELYDLAEVPVLGIPYNRIGVTPGPKERLKRVLGKRDNEYRRVVGRRRA